MIGLVILSFYFIYKICISKNAECPLWFGLTILVKIEASNF